MATRKRLSEGAKDWPKVEFGEYGPVFVVNGPFKGQFAYYDDDDTQRTAIIYLVDEAAKQGRVEIDSRGFHIINRRHLRKPPETATPDWLRGYVSFDDLLDYYQGRTKIQ
jgi:hypothetical protein